MTLHNGDKRRQALICRQAIQELSGLPSGVTHEFGVRSGKLKILFYMIRAEDGKSKFQT
jgi:hypothetical protein